MLKLSGSLLLGLAITFAGSKAATGQSKPIDLTLGWNYAYAGQGPGYANLNGWYGTLIWEATERVGISFVHESYWGPFQGSGTNQHAYLFGPNIELRKGNHKVNPFLQPLAGVTRSSASGSVQEQPSFQLSAGADITLKGPLSLEIIPAEYAFAYGNSTALNSYEAAAGLSWKFKSH